MIKTFLIILHGILPLYFLIILGFIAARFLKIHSKTIAEVLIYILVPGIVFIGSYKAELTLVNLSLPLLCFSICAILGLSFYYGSRSINKLKPIRNILAYSAGLGNTGYFGLPLIATLLPKEIFPLAILTLMGFTIFESTIGFFLLAQARYNMMESFKKLVGLPIFHAFLLGILLNWLIPNTIETTSIEIYFKGAYSFLGMFIVGMGIAKVKFKSFDWHYISIGFFSKFVVWPLFIISLILIDKNYTHFYNNNIYNIFLIYSIVPIAANKVAFATKFNLFPEKAALNVFTSTIFALFYIPIMIYFFMN